MCPWNGQMQHYNRFHLSQNLYTVSQGIKHKTYLRPLMDSGCQGSVYNIPPSLLVNCLEHSSNSCMRVPQPLISRSEGSIGQAIECFYRGPGSMKHLSRKRDICLFLNFIQVNLNTYVRNLGDCSPACRKFKSSHYWLPAAALQVHGPGAQG